MKEAEVFDNAIAECQAFWRRRLFNSHTISTHPIASFQTTNGFTAEEHETLLKFLDSSKAKIAACDKLMAILEEWKEAVAHTDRRRSYLCVMKCPEDAACTWCSTRPWRARNVYNFLRARDMKFPTVHASTTHAGHNETWLEVKARPVESLLEPDALQPSVQKAALGFCDKCPSFGIKSAAEAKNHKSKLHMPLQRVKHADQEEEHATKKRKRLKVLHACLA
jgi:hypothetical protein